MTVSGFRPLSAGIGFWVVAATLLTVMAFSTVPTPLYALYQRQEGFPTVVITVIFAAYAVGVMVSLYLLGHVSDWAGRRRMILVAVALELAAVTVFLASQTVPALIAARIISGGGVGAVSACATASLNELRAASRPRGAAVVAATVAPACGWRPPSPEREADAEAYAGGDEHRPGPAKAGRAAALAEAVADRRQRLTRPRPARDHADPAR